MDEYFPIYCDGRKHHPRREVVTRFMRLTDGSWHERTPKRGGIKADGAGYTLHGDRLDEPGWASNPDVAGEHRVVFSLECRKCKPVGSLDVQERKLFSALSVAWPTRGGEGVTLVELATIIAKQARG